MALVEEVYKELEAEYHKAAETNNLNKIADLVPRFEQLLNDAPHSPPIIFTLATCKMMVGCEGIAIPLFERLAYEIQTAPEIYGNLGTCWKKLNKDELAKECWERALSMKPHEDFYNNLATLYVNTGKPHEGIALCLKAFMFNPTLAKIHWNFALLLLETAHWRKGFEEYEAGMASFDRPIRMYDEDPEKVPFWQGEDGKIVVYGEQGMGDEIMYASCLREFMDDHPDAVFDCHERLEPLFNRSFPGVKTFPTRKQVSAISDWTEGDPPDYKLPMASLWRLYRSDGKWPREKYLVPDPDLTAHYRKRLEETGPGPYVGISWKAGSKSTRDDLRSLKIGYFMPVIEKGGTFISLQYSEGAEEKCQRFHDDTGMTVHHWKEVVEAGPEEERYPGMNYDHTVALINALDLVIVPNTTAVHLCGAIGKQCWTLTPDGAAWRYQLEGDEMYQYGPWVRQIRQEGRPWAEVLEMVGREYESLLSGSWPEPSEG